MKIQIEGNLYIESDSYGYTVNRINTRFNEKKQEDVTTKDILANYPTVQGCAEYIVTKLKVHESSATTLQELVEEVKQTREWIRTKIDF